MGNWWGRSPQCHTAILRDPRPLTCAEDHGNPYFYRSADAPQAAAAACASAQRFAQGVGRLAVVGFSRHGRDLRDVSSLRIDGGPSRRPEDDPDPALHVIDPDTGRDRVL